ncbi:unnamed protein product [Cyprideis torosa]|uniref:Glycosyl transferase family 25 domain-containing protein n=1 Tax=Cyprideis torosa TaxID=163714 RepID=A0A7R8ZNL2_9CRUS|nr:unnamed protein product [Cyprideis torosa]CAG0886610.1 unnamed protein product [Cyprideis torosa]
MEPRWQAILWCVFVICPSNSADVSVSNRSVSPNPDLPVVLVAIQIRNKADILPYFWTLFARLDYPKENLVLVIRADHCHDDSVELTLKWLAEYNDQYLETSFKFQESPVAYPREESSHAWVTERHQVLSLLREEALITARKRKADYFWQLDADVLLANSGTLKALIAAKKPIIAPLLSGPFGFINFELSRKEADEEETQIEEIRSRSRPGVFKVYAVFQCFLLDLKTQKQERLSFLQKRAGRDAPEDSGMIFGRSAWLAGIEVYITNKDLYASVPPSLTEDEDEDDIHDLTLSAVSYATSISGQFPLNKRLFAGNELEVDEDLLGVSEVIVITNKTKSGLYDVILAHGWKSKVVQAVEEEMLNHVDLEQVNAAALDRGQPMSKKDIARLLSHLQAWSKVVEKKDWKNWKTLILEDNVAFQPYAKNILRQSLAELSAHRVKYDILLLGREPFTKNEKEFPLFHGMPSTVSLVGYSRNICGYIVTVNGAIKLLAAEILEGMIPLDEYLSFMMGVHPDVRLSEYFTRGQFHGFSTRPLILKHLDPERNGIQNIYDVYPEFDGGIQNIYDVYPEFDENGEEFQLEVEIADEEIKEESFGHDEEGNSVPAVPGYLATSMQFTSSYKEIREDIEPALDFERMESEFFEVKELVLNQEEIEELGQKNLNVFEANHEDAESPTVLLAIQIRNKAHSLPYFLSLLSQVDYPKDHITLLIRSDHNQDRSVEILDKWLQKHRRYYKDVDAAYRTLPIFYTNETMFSPWVNVRNSTMILLREEALQTARDLKVDYLWMLDADVMIGNHQVLWKLIKAKKGIIAPLIHSFDGYANFRHFVPMTCCSEAKRYEDIRNQEILGTFPVPVVDHCYLINMKMVGPRMLTFDKTKLKVVTDVPLQDMMNVFSLSAKVHNINIYIVNNDMFGYMPPPLDVGETIEDDEERVMSAAIHAGAFHWEYPFEQDIFDGYEQLIDWDNLGIEEVFVINLERRSEKKSFMEKAVPQSVGWFPEFISAFDGMNLDAKELEKMGMELPSATELSLRGEIGCFLSHFKTWERIVAEDLSLSIILEDDAIFEPFAKPLIRKAFHDLSDRNLQWDILYLGRKMSLRNEQEESVFDGTIIRTVVYSEWLVGYVISKQGAQKLINAYNPNVFVPVDEYVQIIGNSSSYADALYDQFGTYRGGRPPIRPLFWPYLQAFLRYPP